MNLSEQVDQIQDNVAYTKQQNPPRVVKDYSIPIGVTSANGDHHASLNVNIISGGFPYVVNCDVIVTFSDVSYTVQCQDNDNLLIENEEGESVSLLVAGLDEDFKELDLWAFKYCVV